MYLLRGARMICKNCNLPFDCSQNPVSSLGYCACAYKIDPCGDPVEKDTKRKGTVILKFADGAKLRLDRVEEDDLRVLYYILTKFPFEKLKELVIKDGAIF